MIATLLVTDKHHFDLIALLVNLLRPDYICGWYNIKLVYSLRIRPHISVIGCSLTNALIWVLRMVQFCVREHLFKKFMHIGNAR